MKSKIIKNSVSEMTIYFYDEIGGWGITPNDIVKELKDSKTKQINVRISSPGGSVFDAIAIANLLKSHLAFKTMYIDGMAASAATLLMLAGDSVVAADNSMFMIHNPWCLCAGDSSEFRKTADTLDVIKETMIHDYANTIIKNKYSGNAEYGKGQPKYEALCTEIDGLLSEETWLNADQAFELGLINEIADSEMTIAAKFDLSKFGYKNIPHNLKKQAVETDARSKELIARSRADANKYLTNKNGEI